MSSCVGLLQNEYTISSSINIETDWRRCEANNRYNGILTVKMGPSLQRRIYSKYSLLLKKKETAALH